ncbi:MAG: hypothetical protein M1830_000999 [Pleopsidium flavum]|nr:MAG: hypothetical protein M1830_000999 [Pleopsidium flavum]
MTSALSTQTHHHTHVHTTPSPSPPPRAPLALTPGPRATRLTELFLTALTHTLKTCSYANFAACFPTPAKHVPDSLHALWKQMNARFEELAKGEFESVLVERSVVEGLNGLDRLVAEAGRRRERGGMGGGSASASASASGVGEGQVPYVMSFLPGTLCLLTIADERPVADDSVVGGMDCRPHTLPPQALYLAHLTPYLQQAQSSLNAKLQTTQSQNAQLVRKIEDQRAEIERLVGGLEGVVSDLEEAREAVGGFVKGGMLAREVLDVDRELKVV